MTFKHMYEQDIIQLWKDQIEHVTDAGQTRTDRGTMEVERPIFAKVIHRNTGIPLPGAGYLQTHYHSVPPLHSGFLGAL